MWHRIDFINQDLIYCSIILGEVKIKSLAENYESAFITRRKK